MNAAALLESRTGRALLLLARVLFWAAAATLAYALCRRGLTLSDEGDVLSGALAILEGKIPYRDIDMFVTPGVWYLNAGIFALAGTSVIATRMAAAVCLLATMAVTRRIVSISAGSLGGDLAAVLIAVFAVWAWPAWTWSFYSPWATLLSMTGFLCTLEWMRSRRSLWLLACGVMVGLAIAFKQNYGVLAAAGCVLSVMLDEVALAAPPQRSLREIAQRTMPAGLWIALGGALVLVPGVLWLYWQSALPAAFDLLVMRPFQGFIEAHTIRYLHFGDFWRQAQIWTFFGWVYMAVPVSATGMLLKWPASAVTLTVLLHIALYWIPPFAFVGFGLRGFFELLRRPPFHERALLATVVFAAVYFLGVFPRCDFNHLINVYQPVLAMLAAGAATLFGKGRWRPSAMRGACLACSGLLFLCFAGISAIWMNDLRKHEWLPLKSPRAGVLVDGLTSQMLNDEIELLQTLTDREEPVFALPNLSMIPFLAERPMPTRYHNYYSVHIGYDKGLDAAHEIELSDAGVVVTAEDNFFSDSAAMLDYGSELTEYLRLHFHPAFRIGSQIILLRRKHVLEDQPALDLLTMCDVRQGGSPAAFSRQHLLHSTLYHSFKGAWASYNQAVTTCQFLVPAQARLRLSLELRNPAPIDGTATAEIWLFRGHARPRRVLRHDWSLQAEPQPFDSAGEEFEVDLSRHEGEIVNLLLRTVVDGSLPSVDFDTLGVSVLWSEGRLESPEYSEGNADAAAPLRSTAAEAH